MIIIFMRLLKDTFEGVTYVPGEGEGRGREPAAGWNANGRGKGASWRRLVLPWWPLDSTRLSLPRIRLRLSNFSQLGHNLCLNLPHSSNNSNGHCNNSETFYNNKRRPQAKQSGSSKGSNNNNNNTRQTKICPKDSLSYKLPYCCCCCCRHHTNIAAHHFYLFALPLAQQRWPPGCAGPPFPSLVPHPSVSLSLVVTLLI